MTLWEWIIYAAVVGPPFAVAAYFWWPGHYR